MNEQSAPKPPSIRMARIQAGPWRYAPPTQQPLQTEKGTTTYGVGGNVLFKKETGQIEFLLAIEGRVISTNEIFLAAEQLFLFQLFNLDTSGQEKTPEELAELAMLSCLSMAWGTMRGIVFERMRGTPFSMELLPTVPPDDLKDLLIKIRQQQNEGPADGHKTS